MRALLIGKEPPCDLGYAYADKEYDTVVIGSLNLSQALRFSCQEVLVALAEGMPVILYEPGFPTAPKNRALGAALAASRRELKSWGVRFTDGGQKKLVTAQEARRLRAEGKIPAPGAVLTPLAQEILEGKQ